MATATIPHSNVLVAWWRDHALAGVDHRDVVERVRDESGWTGRYAFMTLMSAGIAVLGLLLSSPAVVIGAMLISPLMGPIIGLGFGLATFDSDEIRASVIALGLGVVLAILFCALVVLVSPLQNVTTEIAARTRPNLFDLMVALFSALAGAYATIRGRAGTVVGVAIATALMPPLAVVGFGLATLNWTVFAGSLLLFVTNLMTIAVAAAVVARLYGFGSHLSPKHTLLQTVIVFGVFLTLAIPLGIALRQIAWESTSTRQVQQIIADEFGDEARLSQVEIDWQREPIRVSATVLTPEYRSTAQARAAAVMNRALGRQVELELDQYRVGTGSQAEAAQIAAAAREGLANQVATRTIDRLALVAGVNSEDVIVDRDKRRAIVNARPIAGAPIMVYRELEGRVANAASGWSVELVPPAAPLPDISFGTDGPDPQGVAALQTAAWAARRLRVPVGVTGPAAAVDTVVASLDRAGVGTRVVSGANPPGGGVRLSWQAPDASQ